MDEKCVVLRCLTIGRRVPLCREKGVMTQIVVHDSTHPNVCLGTILAADRNRIARLDTQRFRNLLGQHNIIAAGKRFPALRVDE